MRSGLVIRPIYRLATLDPDVLLWAENAGRIVVSNDHTTMPVYLAKHLAIGHHLPGLFLLTPRCTLRAIVQHLVAVTYASESHEWQDVIRFIP